MVTNHMVPMKSNMCTLCGILCLCPGPMRFITELMFPMMADAGMIEVMVTMPKRMVLSNAFPGFDSAYHIPPNFVTTGPIMKADSSDLVQRLE